MLSFKGKDYYSQLKHYIHFTSNACKSNPITSLWTRWCSSPNRKLEERTTSNRFAINCTIKRVQTCMDGKSNETAAYYCIEFCAIRAIRERIKIHTTMHEFELETSHKTKLQIIIIKTSSAFKQSDIVGIYIIIFSVKWWQTRVHCRHARNRRCDRPPHIPQQVVSRKYNNNWSFMNCSCRISQYRMDSYITNIYTHTKCMQK